MEDENFIRYYKDLTVLRLDDFNILSRATEIAKTFIKNKKLIVVGGQAIDFALKLKGKSLYENELLMDLDIISDTHYQDAYALAVLLKRAGFYNISVINALHPSTMKVRINFKEIIDISYIPTNIIKNIPTLWYKGFSFVHPHYQMIDQHRSLSYPYENAPYETVLNRPVKDMMRYDMLYEYYPIRILGPVPKKDFVTNLPKIMLKEISIQVSYLQDQCITGFFALNYWMQEAKQLGFKIDTDLGSIDFSNDKVFKYKVPVEAYGMSIYANDIKELYGRISNEYNTTEKKFYNRFIDKFPRKVTFDIFEIFDLNQKIASYKLSETIHIVNLQAVMLYLVTNYIIQLKVQNFARSYSYYIGYNMCRKLFMWVAKEYYEGNEKMRRFLPTALTYGEINLNDAKILTNHKFALKNQEIDKIEKFLYEQPKHLYDRDLAYGKAPKKYYDFNVKQSALFNFDGNISAAFL
jgi:Poly(A) polymerase catalytic subunit